MKYFNNNKCFILDNIKSYFGENIALYFYFLDFYTKYLLLPAVIGLCHYLFFVDNNKADNVWFAILNLIWTTIFLELWKRKSCYLIFDWGRLKSLKGNYIVLLSSYVLVCVNKQDILILLVLYHI